RSLRSHSSRWNTRQLVLAWPSAAMTDERPHSTAPLNSAHQIIEIDGELFWLGDIASQLFNVGTRKFWGRIAGGFNQQLNHGTVLQHDRADHGFRDRCAGHDDAVVFKKHAAPATERARDAGTHCVRADEIDRVVIGAERVMKERAGLTVTFERATRC